MRCLAFFVLAEVAVVGRSATAQNPTIPGRLVEVCMGVGFPAIRVEVRRGDGRPIAAGATLVVTDGDFKQTTVETWNALTLEAADNRKGTYTVEVSKPFYKTVRIDGVSVPGGPCGAFHTVDVPIALEMLPTAPEIRSVSVAQPGVALGPGLQNQYTVWVDATPGTDTSVTWSVSDPRVATIDQSGLLTAKCRTTEDVLVIATSRLDPARRGTGRFDVLGNPCP